MKSRIAPVDGLRAFAVLGVMWGHEWMVYDHAPLKIGPLDIHRIASFGIVGVDLFFVISGFCMYLMYAKKETHFTIGEYGNFLLKRWKRIAPAFYFIVAVESLIWTLRHHYFPADSFFAHLFFVNTFINDNVLSLPFWSLATEWQFYLVLPFLFVNDPTGKKLWPRIGLLFLICFCIRLVFFFKHNNDILQGITLAEDKIWYRFIEFGWGIIAARLYMTNWQIHKFWKSPLGSVLAFLIAYAGRLIIVTEVIRNFGSMAFIVRALGEPLMTLGFALLLYNVINSFNIFSRILSLPLFQFLGRISYSMYLWHWLILQNLSLWLIEKMGISAMHLNMAYLLSVILVTAIAWLSYKLFEAPYFKKRVPQGTRPVAYNN